MKALSCPVLLLCLLLSLTTAHTPHNKHKYCNCGDPRIPPRSIMPSFSSGLLAFPLPNRFISSKGMMDYAFCNIGKEKALSIQDLLYEEAEEEHIPDFGEIVGIEQERDSFEINFAAECGCDKSTWKLVPSGKQWQLTPSALTDNFTTAFSGGFGNLGSWKCGSRDEVGCDVLKWPVGEAPGSENPNACGFGCSGVEISFGHCRTVRMVFPRGLGLGAISPSMALGSVDGLDCDFSCMVGPSCMSECIVPEGPVLPSLPGVGGLYEE